MESEHETRTRRAAKSDPRMDVASERQATNSGASCSLCDECGREACDRPEPRRSLPENHVLAVTQDWKSLALGLVASTSPERKSAGGPGIPPRLHSGRCDCYGPALRCRADLSTEIECRVDQARVIIGLRKIAQHAAGEWIELLRASPQHAHADQPNSSHPIRYNPGDIYAAFGRSEQ